MAALPGNTWNPMILLWLLWHVRLKAF